MEIEETIEQALIREFREETGLNVKPKQLLHLSEDFFVAPFTKKAYHSLLIYFLCEYKNGEINTQGFDEHEKMYAKKAVWISLDEVPKLKFYNSVDSVSLIKKAANKNAK